MRRTWEWLGLNLGRRAGRVAIVGLLVTVALGAGITLLRFTTSNSDYLNHNDPAWINNVNYSKVFGGDPIAILFTMKPGTTVDNLLTKQNITQFKKIETDLDNSHCIFSAVTPLDALSLAQTLLSSPTGSPLGSPAAAFLERAVRLTTNSTAKAARSRYLITEGTDLTKIPPSQQVLSNPTWMQFLIHEPNGSVRQSLSTFVASDHAALMAVYLKGNININQETTAANCVQRIVNEGHFQNVSIVTTGVPALLKTINDYLKHGITTLAIAAGVIMVAILLLSFSVRWRLLPWAIVAIGLVWGFGLVGYFHVPLTLATIAALPVLLGVGMDYSIQMHSRIEEEVVLARASHPIQAAARGLGPALLVVTFDAVFAFMALWFAKTPAIREFGSLLVIGIIAVCVCSIISTLAVLGIREYKSPTKGKDFSQGRLSRIVVFLGSVPQRFAIPLAGLSVVILLSGIALEGRLQLQTDPIQWVNPHSQAIKDILTLKQTTGSDNELAMRISTNQPFSNQTVDYVARFSKELESKYPHYLWPAAGLVNTIDQFVNNLPNTGEIPPSGAEIKQIYEEATPGIRKTTVADAGGALNVIFRGRTDTLTDLSPVVKDLEGGINPPKGITVAPGGIATVGVGLIENLEKSRIQLTYLALLFVGAFLALRLRSLVRALLSLVPVLVAVGAVSLIGVAFSLKLSPVTAVAGPLVVAVCTEFTSLILLRFVEERARGLDPRAAMDATASRTGRAFMVSGMTAIAGVGTLALSSMPLLSEFGVIVAINVSVALLSALVVLPPILVWADQHNWVSRGLIKATPEPYLTTQERLSSQIAPPSTEWRPAPSHQPSPLPPPPPPGVPEPVPVSVASAPNGPVPNGPVPSAAVPNGPAPSTAVPNGPLPDRPVPSAPATSEPASAAPAPAVPVPAPPSPSPSAPPAEPAGLWLTPSGDAGAT